jgi:hypothetical protein
MAAREAALHPLEEAQAIEEMAHLVISSIAVCGQVSA